MKVIFDNNLSPHMAHAMRELSSVEPDVSAVIHLRDRFAPNTPDIEWITSLDGPWIIVSIDRFTKNNDAERAALRRAGHTVFVLDRQWSEKKFWLKAAQLVVWWPLILGQARIAEGSFRVPWKQSGQTKLQTLRL